MVIRETDRRHHADVDAVVSDFGLLATRRISRLKDDRNLRTLAKNPRHYDPDAAKAATAEITQTGDSLVRLFGTAFDSAIEGIGGRDQAD
jgi:hypothetical protein